MCVLGVNDGQVATLLKRILGCVCVCCRLYTSEAAAEGLGVRVGGRGCLHDSASLYFPPRVSSAPCVVLFASVLPLSPPAPLPL